MKHSVKIFLTVLLSGLATDEQPQVRLAFICAPEMFRVMGKRRPPL